MNIGIIVYSKTGNTLLVAERIRVLLAQTGLQSVIRRFTAEAEEARPNATIKLTDSPDPNPFDALILGAPVQAFSLDPAMSLYLRQIGSIKKMPTMCFITQHFKRPWLGGNRAMRQILALLKARGLAAVPLGVVNWTNEQRDQQIEQIAEQCVKTLKKELFN